MNDKLTPAVTATILAELAKGHYRKVACAAARITERTLQKWQKRGEAGEEPYATFLIDMQEVESTVEGQLLSEIRNAKPAVNGEGGHGADVWTARAWILERRWPKRWSGRVRVSVSEEIDAFTQRLKNNPELYARVMDALREESPGEPAAAVVEH